VLGIAAVILFERYEQKDKSGKPGLAPLAREHPNYFKENLKVD
jgi:hypothetical protein